jgi:S-DNA-T family DNA segregation ATPase FtsK/SpoIIIE
VLLVIDNWGALAQELEPHQVEAIGGLVGGGLHHGVHLILASTRWQDIKLSMRDNIGGRFELRLGDPIDSEIDRAALRMLPADIPGRGIGPDGQQVQVALPRLDDDLRQITLADGIEQAVSEVRRRWSDSPVAAPVRVLPDLVTTVPGGTGPGVVMGLEEHRLGPWEIDLFGRDPHLLVLGDAESGRTNLLRRLAVGLTDAFDPSHLQIAVVDYRRQLAGAIPESHCLAVATTPESAAILASRVTAAISARAPNDSAYGGQQPHIVVLVDDYDLVAGATSNPLSPLADRVGQGRDLGLHLVIARRVGGVGRSSFETLFHRVRELSTPGVVLSGDPHEGPVLGAVKAMPRQPGRGMWVSKGRVTEVQTILCDGQTGPGESVHRITGALG